MKKAAFEEDAEGGDVMRDEHGVVVVKCGGQRQLVQQFRVVNGNDVEEKLKHSPNREDELNAGRR